MSVADAFIDMYRPSSEFLRLLQKSFFSFFFSFSCNSSGTSYTLEMIASITDKPLATNYAAETDKFHNSARIPVFQDEPSGPFWLANRDQSSDHHLFSSTDVSPADNSQSLVLTKTHCGGYCAGCSLRRMARSYNNFLEECASDAQPAVPYDPYKHVKKAVHLIRNPFDNVVSRYHHQVGAGKIKVDDFDTASATFSFSSSSAFFLKKGNEKANAAILR